MAYYILRPDVAGELGDGTDLDTSVHPPVVHRLEYVVSGWFGADLVESFPCYLVSAQLGKALREAGLGAFELDDVQVTITPEAEGLRQQLGLDDFPEFRWLRVSGKAGRDDLGVDERASLVVSDRALEVFRQFNLEGCDFEDFA